MSDTAAFFANKKKKKKAFKFNANLVDASTVTSSVHVDAPALSTESDPATISALQGKDGENARDDDEQWDDAALAATTTVKKVIHPPSNSVEVLDMKSYDSKRSPEVDIAEKLRLEETKAQLAAAREGMEREAQKLRDEQEKKKEVGAGNRFSAAASMAGGGGVKWLPPHMRGGAAAAPMPGARSQKLDVQNEELFPDLASADKILEQKERQSQPLFKPPKKTPVGGGASWATKQKASAAAAAKASETADAPAPGAESETPTPEPALVPESPEKEPAVAAPAPAAAKPSVAAAPAASKDVAKKPTKKKKDLSTFKPKSAS